MRRRAPILTAVDDQLISSGIQLDRHELKRLLWEHAANVTFWNGTIKRKIPAAVAYAADGLNEPVRGLSQQQAINGSRWLWSAVEEQILRWQFGAPEVVDPAFGTYIADATATQRPTLYDFTHFGDWTIINNSVEPAKLHKPGISYAAYPNAPVGAVRFMKKMNFMLAIGYGQRGTQVGWSDADAIEIWTAEADNLAGAVAVEEMDTPIQAASKIGDAISVYAEDQMGLIRYIGLPYVFGQKTVVDGIGAVGKAAVATDTRMNVGVGRAGVWQTDGNSARYIDEGWISDYLQENVNWDQGAKIVAARNDYTGCFEFHFPMQDSLDINEAWSWDPRMGGWAPCPYASAMDERRLFNHPIQGSHDGRILLTDFNPLGEGALSLRTKPLVVQSADSPHVVVRVDEFDLLLHDAHNVEVRIGCSDEPNGDWEWTSWVAAETGAKIYQVQAAEALGQPLPEAAFWKLEFRSAAGANDWRFNLQGFMLYGVNVGTKM